MNQYPRVTDVFLRLNTKYQKVGMHDTCSHLHLSEKSVDMLSR